MIWATVSSRSCFGWLYRASPSLAAKNIINMILVLTIWWCPCVESSLVLLEGGCLLWPVRSLGKTLLAFVLLHSVFQGQICLLVQVFLDFLLYYPWSCKDSGMTDWTELNQIKKWNKCFNNIFARSHTWRQTIQYHSNPGLCRISNAEEAEVAVLWRPTWPLRTIT